MSDTPSLAQYARSYFDDTIEILSSDLLFEPLAKVIQLLTRAREQGNAIYFFGNGGSAATSSHMSQDLGKLTINKSKPRFRTHSLADPLPLILAWANDSSYAEIFSEQILSHGRSGDIAVGISGSGNSPNVLKALETARHLKMVTVGLIGSGGGKMARLCDISIIVPSSNMQHIEDLHHMILHLATSYLRDSDSMV